MPGYFRNLSRGRVVLWCYLIWYLFFAARYFDASPSLWLSSLGISAIIGVALILSTSTGGPQPAPWTVFRLFLMPFCVSSFSALIKGRGFVLIFSAQPAENAAAVALCAAFCLLVFFSRSRPVAKRPPN